MLDVAKKYILAFPKEKEIPVFELMEQRGCFEVIKNEQEGLPLGEIEKAIQQADYLVSSLSFAINYINPFAKKISIVERINNPKIILKHNDVSDLKEKERIIKIIERVIHIEKRIDESHRNNKENEAKIKELDNFNGLLFVPQDTVYTSSFIVKMSGAQADKFTEFTTKNKIYKKELLGAIGKIYLLLIVSKEEKEKVIDFVKECKGDIVTYPFEKTPAQEKTIINSEIEQTNKDIARLNKELIKIASNIKELKIYHDFLIIERTRLNIQKDTLDKGFLNYVLFWSQNKELAKFEKEIKSISKEIIIIETEIDKDELAPVILENNKAVRPFEYVTEIFGLPKGNEIDPTPYLAVFFILFFGICITDAGYGLVMALMCGIGLIFFKKLVGNNKLIRLMFYGGISTFVIGVLFGSYFGTSPEVLRISFMNRLKVIDPIKDTVLFMGITFLLGYIQLTFSQVVKIISGKRNKNKEMLFSGMAWLSAFLFGGLLIASTKVEGLKTIGLFGLIISGGGLLLAESIGTKIFLKPLVGGVKVLQGLINSMSDILSYSRLMALGLATAVIALIVNQIAVLFSGMIPYVGWVVGGLILIGGHLFNLGINALSGFIHSGRLQFVEFFPKFLEGGGRRMQPTRSELKYVQVENN